MVRKLWLNAQVINNSCGTLAALNAVMNIAPQEGQTPEETISHGVGRLMRQGVFD